MSEGYYTSWKYRYSKFLLPKPGQQKAAILSLGLLRQVTTQQMYKRTESPETLHLSLLFDPVCVTCFLELLHLDFKSAFLCDFFFNVFFRFLLLLQEQDIKKVHFNNRRKIFPCATGW